MSVTSPSSIERAAGAALRFLAASGAMLVKEFIQLRRDRVLVRHDRRSFR